MAQEDYAYTWAGGSGDAIGWEIRVPGAGPDGGEAVVRGLTASQVGNLAALLNGAFEAGADAVREGRIA